MPSSKLLKERIESIQDTMKITNAMYLISSSKLRKARKNYQNVSPYFNRMRDTISRVVPHLPEEPVHPFFHERNIANPKRAYIVLTADKGMAGAYNQNIIKFLKENADENDRFYVIGQTGYRALYHKDPRLVEDFHYSATEPTLQRARDITVDAIDDFKTGKLDEIYLIYTRIENALTSEPTMVRLLPLDRAHLQPAPKGLGDPKGEVEMFPSAWTVFEQTAPIYMHGMIFGAMTESFCAEQSARMTAMDSATKSANDMIRELQLEYNRTRQGSITQEITEIIGGAAGGQHRAFPRGRACLDRSGWRAQPFFPGAGQGGAHRPVRHRLSCGCRPPGYGLGDLARLDTPGRHPHLPGPAAGAPRPRAGGLRGLQPRSAGCPGHGPPAHDRGLSGGLHRQCPGL